MKHRLIEFLASELRFSIFSIEANMPEAYRLNDYVLHGTGDPKALLQGMYFWTWNTEEVLAMIEWMRQFNAAGKSRIQFTGFDMQTIRVAVGIVDEFLHKVDADCAADVRAVFQEASNLKPAQGSFGVATGTFPVAATAGRKITFSGAIKTEDVNGFAGLWWRADGPKGSLAFDNMQDRAPRLRSCRLCHQPRRIRRRESRHWPGPPPSHAGRARIVRVPLRPLRDPAVHSGSADGSRRRSGVELVADAEAASFDWRDGRGRCPAIRARDSQ